MSATSGLGFTPVFKIQRGDIDLTSNFEDRAISVTVNLKLGGGEGDDMWIELDDRDACIASPSVLSESPTILSISMGYAETALYEMGTFYASHVNYSGLPRSMTITGTSFGSDNAAKAPLITSHDTQTVGDIVNGIAKAAGVSAVISPELAAKQIPYLNQHESSYHLLQELERRYDGLAKFADGTLSFTVRGSNLTASGAAFGSLTVFPEDLASWNVDESNRSGFAKVRASYWDQTQHQLVWLDNTNKSAAGSSAAPFMLKRGFPSKDEAQSAANSMQAKLNRGLRTGSLTLVKGDPSIRAGQNVTLSGVRDGVDGTYLISIATHHLDRQTGLSTTLEFYDNQDSDSEQLQDGQEPETVTET